MIEGILGVLTLAFACASFLTGRQNYKQKIEINSLKQQLIAFICDEDNGQELLPSAIGAHNWEAVGDYLVIFGGIKDRSDKLRTEKCAKCGLIKRFWIGGLGRVYDTGKNRMGGLFRTTHLLEEEDERMVPCQSNKLQLLLEGKRA